MSEEDDDFLADLNFGLKLTVEQRKKLKYLYNKKYREALQNTQEWKDKTKRRMKDWRKKNPERAKTLHDKYNKQYRNQRLGITDQFIDAIIKLQEGKCCICKQTPKRFVVDHCDETQTFRGVICDNCNLGIGHFKDDIELLKAAIEYLERHQQ